MKVGITGTREGMNEYQFEQVQTFLKDRYREGAEFHHGDCVGVDAEAATLAQQLGYRVVNHPGPNHDGLRAYIAGDEIREPQSHFKRNRSIVDSCDFLLVVPLQNKHQPRGGTWYTYDYAVKKNKQLKLILRGSDER